MRRGTAITAERLTLLLSRRVVVQQIMKEEKTKLKELIRDQILRIEQLAQESEIEYEEEEPLIGPYIGNQETLSLSLKQEEGKEGRFVLKIFRVKLLSGLWGTDLWSSIDFEEIEDIELLLLLFKKLKKFNKKYLKRVKQIKSKLKSKLLWVQKEARAL